MSRAFGKALRDGFPFNVPDGDIWDGTTRHILRQTQVPPKQYKWDGTQWLSDSGGSGIWTPDTPPGKWGVPCSQEGTTYDPLTGDYFFRPAAGAGTYNPLAISLQDCAFWWYRVKEARVTGTWDLWGNTGTFDSIAPRINVVDEETQLLNSDNYQRGFWIDPTRVGYGFIISDDPADRGATPGGGGIPVLEGNLFSNDGGDWLVGNDTLDNPDLMRVGSDYYPNFFLLAFSIADGVDMIDMDTGSQVNIGTVDYSYDRTLKKWSADFTSPPQEGTGYISTAHAEIVPSKYFTYGGQYDETTGELIGPLQ